MQSTWTQVPASWGNFKAAVESEFGVNETQQHATFYATRPNADESTTQFVLRVENQRRLLSLPEDSCLLAFKGHFSVDFCA